MSSLPGSGLVAFLGGIKYLSHTSEDGEFNNALMVRGNDVLTPNTRFYLEPSTNHEGFVHIRSCYNNKYWIPKKVKNSWYIIADGREPQEEEAEPYCTLFELKAANEIGREVIRLRACSSLVEEARSLVGETEVGCLFVSTDGSLQWRFLDDMDLNFDFFKIITLDEEKLLPKYARFKGDNGKYLGSDVRKVSRFECTDPFDARVIHSIHYSDDAKFIRIKSEKTGLFWRRDNTTDWIAAVEDSSSKKEDNISFQVVRLGGNMIALKNKGNNKFAKMFTNTSNFEDCLNACGDSIEKCAMLQLEEAVLTRKIYNVEYDLSAAKIYDQKALVMATANSVNCSNTTTTAKLNLKYGLATINSWRTSTTKSWGVNAAIHAGVPKLFKFGLELNIDIDGHYESNDTEDKEGTKIQTEEHSVEYDMNVPPRTKMTVHAIATKASCDIPYSYYQRDILANGETVVTKLADGLFHGVNSYEFTYKVLEEKLSDDQLAEEQGVTKEPQKKRKQNSSTGNAY